MTSDSFRDVGRPTGQAGTGERTEELARPYAQPDEDSLASPFEETEAGSDAEHVEDLARPYEQSDLSPVVGMTGETPADAHPSHTDPRARPIGVFDSGVGGLTVLHELLVRLPREDFLYLGDTARFPYGERSPEELARFSSEIAEELLRRRAKLLVIACNSATAAALPILVKRMMETTLGVDVLGVVRPEALQAVAATRNGRIGLLATPTTVASGSYERAVGAVDPHVTLHPVACPTLASIIQAGEQFDERAVQSVREACTPLSEAGVDTVILGCTHYPLISPMLQRMLGPDVKLVSSGGALARQVEHALSTRGLQNPRERGEGEYRFLCTSDTEAFRGPGTRFLQMPLGMVEHVDLSGAGVLA